MVRANAQHQITARRSQVTLNADAVQELTIADVHVAETTVSVAFDAMTSGILHDVNDPDEADARLWRVPANALAYALLAVTPAQRASLVGVERLLRQRVCEIIENSLDRTTWLEPRKKHVASAQQHLTLRSWSHGDLPEYHTLLDNQELWTYLPEPYPAPLTLEMADDLIEVSNAFPERHTVHAVEYEGKPIGQVRLQLDSSKEADEAEISYWIGQPYWNKGLATEIVALGTVNSFKRLPNVDRIFARVIAGNDASVRVLEKAGYHHELRLSERDGRETDEFAVYRAEYTGILQG